MTMRRTGLIAAALAMVAAGASVAEAALAPKYDRLRQFETVLGSQVVDALGERPIDRIVRRKDGVFVVHAGECMVFVTLKALPRKDGMVGATGYEIAEVSPPACR
ncbi:hypothetical protein [Microbaculum sp. FT89]|uniref:hypothetical protein n=1 Tax=Microbaculum sp. FT89 TaxID=3447298 RepID=UPI003F534292